MPEAGGAEILLKIAPAQRAQEVAKVDQQDGENNVEEVGALDRIPELLTAEAPEIERMTGVV